MDIVFLQQSRSGPTTYVGCDVYHATHFSEDGGPVRPISEFDGDGPADNTASLVRNVPRGHREEPLPLPAMHFGANEEPGADPAPDGPLELPQMHFGKKRQKQQTATGNAGAGEEPLPLPSMDAFLRKQAG